MILSPIVVYSAFGTVVRAGEIPEAILNVWRF